MSTNEIKSIILTLVGVVIFSIVFTILYKSLIKTEISEIEDGEDDIELIDEIIHENDVNVKKRRKIAGSIRSVIFYLFLAILIGLFGYGIYSQISGKLPMINGKSVMVVASGSMSQKHEVNEYLFDENLNNQIPTYAIIILEEVTDASELKQYDVIAFVNDKGVNLIHRIKEIIDVDGTTRYITRGDSNNENDAYYPSIDDVVGKYSGEYIPALGLAVMFIQSIPGIITLLGIAYCVVFMDIKAKERQDFIDKRTVRLANFIWETDGSPFDEIIYYQNFEYHFNQDGFIEKKELSEKKPYYDAVNDRMIKVMRKNNMKETISELIFDAEIEGGN